MRITILDDYQHVVSKLECFKLLKGQDVSILHDSEKDVNVLAEKLKDVDIIVLTRERTKIDAELLSKLPGLKLISQTGKVSGHINMDDCKKYNVTVMEGAGSPIAPAELTWALIMNTVRQIPQAIEGMKEGKWQVNIGNTVYGKTIGIWGYGKIGKRIAGYAKAFGAKVLVWGSEPSRDAAVQDGFERAENKQDFFERSDVVTLHLRLSEATFGIVRKEDLGMMKPDSVFINTARAELVENGALLNSLKNHRPGFAGIDVYEEEPVYNPDYALLTMPNVVCTPHLGYVEMNSYELYFGQAFENVMNFINSRHL